MCVKTAEVREPVSEGDDGVLSHNPWQVKDGWPLVLSHLMLVAATQSRSVKILPNLRS